MSMRSSWVHLSNINPVTVEPLLRATSLQKWSLGADWLIAAGVYPVFCSMKWLGVFLLLVNGMLVHRRSLPCNLLGFPNNSPIPIYTPGWREALWELSFLPKNTTQCPWPGLEPGPLNPGTSALTMRPPCLPPLYSSHTCPFQTYFNLPAMATSPQWPVNSVPRLVVVESLMFISTVCAILMFLESLLLLAADKLNRSLLVQDWCGIGVECDCKTYKYKGWDLRLVFPSECP